MVEITEAGPTLEITEEGGPTIEIALSASTDVGTAQHVADATGAHAASAIAFTPAGGVAAGDVQAAILEVAADAAAELAAHVSDATGAHAASSIAFTAAGGVSAGDVQGAIVEVAADASAALAGHVGTSSGAHAASSIAFAASGGIVSADVQGAVLEVSGSLVAHVGDATAAHAASSIAVTPAGGVAASDVQGALLELDAELVAHVGDGTAAHAAGAIAFTPAGGVAASDVQGAVVEVAASAASALAHVSDPLAAHAASSIAFTPAGGVGAGDVQAAIVEVAADAAAELFGHVWDAAAAHAASSIAFTPAGGVSASDVQGALVELDAEKSAIGHVHDAGAITTGTIADARLPARLGALATQVNDANSATSNGWYLAPSGSLNMPPDAGAYSIFVEAHRSDFFTQTARRFGFDSSSDSQLWRREWNNNAWGAWYRLRVAEAELDARYLNASNLTAGTVPAGRLPARLNTFAKFVTDWNAALENGWYASSTGAAVNGPTSGAYLGHVEVYSSSWITQTVHEIASDGSGDTRTWRRGYDSTAWTAWYRIRWSEAELDARYASRDASTLTSGTLADARLPNRLMGVPATAVTDWNNCTENGFYTGFGASNAPEAGAGFVGIVQRYQGTSNIYVTQIVHKIGADGPSDSLAWKRECNFGTWGSWYRIRMNEAELDARYALASTVSGHIGAASAAHAASAIAFTPDGSFVATDVQAAFLEARRAIKDANGDTYLVVDDGSDPDTIIGYVLGVQRFGLAGHTGAFILYDDQRDIDFALSLGQTKLHGTGLIAELTEGVNGDGTAIFGPYATDNASADWVAGLHSEFNEPTAGVSLKDNGALSRANLQATQTREATVGAHSARVKVDATASAGTAEVVATEGTLLGAHGFDRQLINASELTEAALQIPPGRSLVGAMLTRHVAGSDPTPTDDNTKGHLLLGMWLTTSTPARVFVCTDNTTNAALWERLL